MISHMLMANMQLSVGIDCGDDDEMVDDNAECVDLDAELLSWLYRVEVKVHHDLKYTPGHDCIGDISQESAEQIVP